MLKRYYWFLAWKGLFQSDPWVHATKSIKMKLFYLFLILSTTASQCSSQKVSLGNTKKSDRFLRWILDNRKETLVSNQPVKLDMGALQNLSEEINFSKKDSVTIEKQIKENNKTFFDAKLIPNKTLLNDSRIKKEREKSTYLFIKISKPIFFNNKVWIIVEEYCGDSCGSGQLEVYGVEKSGYSLLFRKRLWIS